MMPGPLGPARTGGSARAQGNPSASAPRTDYSGFAGPDAVPAPPSPSVAQNQAPARAGASLPNDFEEDEARPSARPGSEQTAPQGRPLTEPPADAPPKRFAYFLRLVALIAGIMLLLHPAAVRTDLTAGWGEV